MGDPTLLEVGEDRHSTCRFGTLTPAFHVDMSGRETPTVGPLCLWQPTGPTPPAMSRAWGGLIDLERDCAVCPCFSPLTTTEPSA